MRPFATCLFLLLLTGYCRDTAAQPTVTRQVLASTVQSSTGAGPGFLQFTGHAGETFIGTVDGDVRATVGFQQPDDDVAVSVFTIGGRALTVRAYPNPVVADLTVQLDAAAPFVTELFLFDLHGRPVLRQPTGLQPVVVLQNAGRLPSGMYLLRARTTAGDLAQLARVLVVPR